MINVRLFNTLFELLEAFPTEESCIKYLESLRWKEGIVSPFDPTSKVYICNKGYLCKNTGKRFNVLTEQSLKILNYHYVNGSWLFG